MIKVALHGAEFFARHGFYQQEQILGNKFIVDIEVEFPTNENLNDDNIANTVNYEQLYAIAQHEMQQTKKLIETVCSAIIDQIKNKYLFIEHARVVIKKLDPPLQGKVEYSSVEMNYHKAAHGI